LIVAASAVFIKCAFSLSYVVSPKSPPTGNKEGRGSADVEWDKQMRLELAKRKGENVLFKEDQSVIKDQFERESKIRSHVQRSIDRVKRASCLLHTLIDAHPEAMHGFIQDILLGTLPGAFSAILAGATYSIYLALARCVSLRLIPVAESIAVAYFRLNHPHLVETRWVTEPMSGTFFLRFRLSL
jgi:hypothetical protein